MKDGYQPMEFKGSKSVSSLLHFFSFAKNKNPGGEKAFLFRGLFKLISTTNPNLN
jgi:hypothetical protein